MIIQTGNAQRQQKSAFLSISQLGSPEYPTMVDIWQMMDDCFAGELAIKAQDEKYIYRPESKRGAKSQRKWDAYKGRGKFPNLPMKELKKSIGILCAKSPEVLLDGKAARLEFLREFATPYRDGLDALFLRTVENVLRYGRYCLLLEPTNDDERGFHINEFRPQKFIRAKYAEKDGVSFAKMILLDTSSIDYDTTVWRDVYCPQITLLALTEPTATSPGVYYQAKFGSRHVVIDGYRKKDRSPIWQDVEQYRTAMSEVMGALESFDIENPDPNKCTEFAIPDKYGKTLDRIPFTCINASSLNFMRYENPPLLGQCLKCLHILNADCDHQQAVYMTTDPIPTFKGVVEGGEIKMSADNALTLGENQDFNYTVAPSAGLQMQADNIARMLADAQQEGVFLAGSEQAVNTSGYALEIQRNSQTADLRQINTFCGKGIEEQLRTAGAWIGMSDDEISNNIKFTPSTDFADIKPTMQEAVAFCNAADKLSITAEERRKWAEKNLGIEHKDWDELQAELDAEKATAELDAFGNMNIPPVVPGEEEEEEEQDPEQDDLTDGESGK